MTRFGETEADDFFRLDAERLGYLDDIVEIDEFWVEHRHSARGLRAYYRDHGMIQPEVLDKELPAIEVVGLDLDRPVGDDE